jgi:ABC-2 type transport system permease protein
MNNLSGMIWVELRKAIRSRMPLWTTIGALFLPLGITFMIFVSKNPEISQKLGLMSAKADLVAFAATDWPAYLNLYGQMVAIAGFFLFILVISWVFGREFVDGTLKDLLAVPIPRASILLAKYITVALWSAGIIIIIFITGLVMGVLIGLPGGTTNVLFQGSTALLVTSCLVFLVVAPFALFASLGRGYLLPIGVAVLVLMMANLMMILGWGEYFPFAVPALYAQGKSPLPQVSFWIVLITCLAGMLATFLWWKYADQSR